MSQSTQVHPISIRTLWDNFWVFGLYGIVIAVLFSIFSSFNVDLKTIRGVMMEPWSIYSFSSLSVFGLIVLSIINATVAKTGGQMRKSWWVQNIWVPITNAGLSTGSVMTGTLLGLAVGMFVSSCFTQQALPLSRLFGAIGLYSLMILYPLTILTRLLFDETQSEKRASTWASIIYCAIVTIIFWLADETVFWELVAKMVAALIVFTAVLWWLRRKNANRSVH